MKVAEKFSKQFTNEENRSYFMEKVRAHISNASFKIPQMKIKEQVLTKERSALER